ncbi:hypothetical protein QYF61_017532 [Mycteria americana]|uniref:Uncharacterized protein n=1 Tax=Mycteria americana TaxID=33587 RepID=A0AAN7NUV4_MYCAM|nr:hypothetical protein QYF61_017532 [Mycteria americana]
MDEAKREVPSVCSVWRCLHGGAELPLPRSEAGAKSGQSHLARTKARQEMAEQLKLLRRPLSPKLPSKLSTPREKVAGRIFGQYLTRVITNANTENGKAVAGTYISAQGQVKQMLPSAMIIYPAVQCKSNPKIHACLFIRFVMVKHKSNSKTPFFRLISSLAVHSPSLTTLLLAQYISNTDMHSDHGQIQFQPKTTDLHGLRRGLFPSEASLPTKEVEQKGDRYSPGLVHKDNDPACWSLPGVTASRVDQYEIIPVYSSSQMPNQRKEKNIFSVQTPRRDFIITKNPNGPDSFPSHKNHKLQSTGRAYFTPIFTLESLAAGSSSHPLTLKTTLKKPLVSHYNCEVLSSQLMTKKRSFQTEVNTIDDPTDYYHEVWSPSHGIQSFKNCSSMSPFHRVQSFRNGLLQSGLHGLQFLPENLLLHWLSMGCRADICFDVVLHGLQGDNVCRHSVHHGLQGNLCSGTWSTSSPSFFTDPAAVQCFALFKIHFPRGTTILADILSCALWWVCWSQLEPAVSGMGAAPELFSQKPPLEFPTTKTLPHTPNTMINYKILGPDFLGHNYPSCTHTGWGQLAGKWLCRQGPGILVDDKLNMRQHHALGAKKTNHMLASELVKPHLEYCVQFGALQYEMDIDTLWQRPTKMVRGLEHMTLKESLRAGFVQP